MSEETGQQMDWRNQRDAERQLKGNRAVEMMQQIERELGVVFKAIIVVSADGRLAEARIVVDLADSS